MDSLTLKCPLCCEETFTSHQSLKYHILSITENLFCPSCDKRFYNLSDLTEHLGRECTDENSDVISNNKRDLCKNEKSLPNESSSFSGVTLVPKVEVKGEEETYFCHMCNIDILSVEDHLSEFHQGEEIIMVGVNLTFCYCTFCGA